MLYVVDADISVDRGSRHGAIALPDDIEVAVGADLLAERVPERRADLAGDPGGGGAVGGWADVAGVGRAVVLAEQVGGDHGLGARAGRRVERHQERGEVVGAGV